ncbi:uncharacterized protein LOC120406028 isoform X2 [Mauremys reevesii]|uniref:uncharacterized protein LOC120406028 isoform X2 n=1 Tax=Mauremys reevesii TaxID=260615 RepID=UPI00193F66DC|nr:uncharacterized protein LOC120406028 isoform X2 [Mauremys reevesii]
MGLPGKIQVIQPSEGRNNSDSCNVAVRRNWRGVDHHCLLYPQLRAQGELLYVYGPADTALKNFQTWVHDACVFPTCGINIRTSTRRRNLSQPLSSGLQAHSPPPHSPSSSSETSSPHTRTHKLKAAQGPARTTDAKRADISIPLQLSILPTTHLSRSLGPTQAYHNMWYTSFSVSNAPTITMWMKLDYRYVLKRTHTEKMIKDKTTLSPIGTFHKVIMAYLTSQS